MTIKDLEEYRWLKKEVKILTKRIEKMHENPAPDSLVTDSVRASARQSPYQEHVITITGLGGKHRVKYAKVKRLLENRIQRIADSIVSIEEFIDTVTRSDIRQIIEYRYIQGLSWRAVSQRVYDYPSETRARQAITRFFAEI